MAQTQPVARRYRLVREPGRGGMSTVWLAADELLGRMVAIKELRPQAGLTDEKVLTHQRRARQEARSVARIAASRPSEVCESVRSYERGSCGQKRGQPIAEKRHCCSQGRWRSGRSCCRSGDCDPFSRRFRRRGILAIG
jgi:serine/threonine protein kinase